MNITKIFAVTVDSDELPDFDAQALKTVLEAALSDDVPIFVDVSEVSISVPTSTTNITVDLPVQSYNNGDDSDKKIESIDVASKNAKLRAEKGSSQSFSEKIKDLQGTHETSVPDLPALKPTGDATPHNAPGKNSPCTNPTRTRESLRGTGSIEFCTTCGYQYRDSDLTR